MKNRLKLDEELRDFLLVNTGSSNLYFQPPENVKIKFPCIIYNLKDINLTYADDLAYSGMKSYELKLICKNPDNDYVENLLRSFKYIRFDRSYVNDNLNHYAFVLYY